MITRQGKTLYTYFCEHGNFHIVIECDDGSQTVTCMDINSAMILNEVMCDQITDAAQSGHPSEDESPEGESPVLN